MRIRPKSSCFAQRQLNPCFQSNLASPCVSCCAQSIARTQFNQMRWVAATREIIIHSKFVRADSSFSQSGSNRMQPGPSFATGFLFCSQRQPCMCVRTGFAVTRLRARDNCVPTPCSLQPVGVVTFSTSQTTLLSTTCCARNQFGCDRKSSFSTFAVRALKLSASIAPSIRTSYFRRCTSTAKV
jgi:hypothetical protein